MKRNNNDNLDVEQRRRLRMTGSDTPNNEMESTLPNGRSSPQVLQVMRPYYEQEQLNNELLYSKPKSNGYQEFLPKPSNFSIWHLIKSIFPILDWLPKYSWKNDLVADIVTGCTVAVMHIPQGMGYALLGNVPPIAGIYMAFFPVLVYVIFGTSRHNSMGTFAVISIMVGKVVQSRATADASAAITANLTATDAPPTEVYTPTDVATAVCFLAGVMQLVMFALRLGIVTSLLSETLVSGFTTGAAIYVFTSQIKDVLGISIKSQTGICEVVLNYIEIFKNIVNVNWVAFGLAATTMVILAINNEILKPRLAKMCAFPVPIELIIVLGGTLASKYLYLQRDYSVKILGNIPTGFPEMAFPKVTLLQEVIVDSIPIAIVSYAVAVSMAMIFAQKLNYEVNSNQELLAMGAGNVVGSLFSCMPFSASLSRSIIQQTVGGRTQIASVFSCLILAFVLLWIGPFFEPLPRSVLAGIILIALKGMLKQLMDFFKFWKLSRLDAVVWLATFLTVVFVAIDIGLLVGIILSLSCIFIRGMKPYTCLLGQVANTDLYLDIRRYKAAEEIPNIKIFHFCGSINFASRDTFKNELCSTLGMDLAKELKRCSKLSNQHVEYDSTHLGFKCLILDFSALSYIDPSGVSSLKSIINEFHKLSAVVYVAGCSCPVYEVMKKCDLRNSSDGRFKQFPTVHDAVHYAMEVITPISVVNVKDSS
ncbi:solute carrier family 26 member 6-like isoform X1 [Hermetia illucens]|nr:solute carrier family 26 member 6-like isoform X1 [Hermetia illucens]XP_037917494.1 solute carrier family 26 member 6-like isoform X1 [Hermetia illucens]